MDKTCNNCSKNVDKFYGHRYGNVCASCYKSLNSKIYREKNKEKIAENKRKWSQTEAAKLLHANRSYKYQGTEKGKKTTSKATKKYRDTDRGRYIMAKNDALYKNKEWNLTQDEYTLLVNNSCHYCDNQLTKVGIGLDRIDNLIGYTVSNVVLCCKDCNRTRGDRFTVEEMRAIMNFIKIFRSKNG